MRIVATILGATAGFVFIAASAAMNWMFMITQGKTVLEGQVLGLVSIATDVVKALMPFFIGAAWAHRHWLRTLLGASVFGLFFSFSLLSALGFVATNRGAVANSRAALSSQLESPDAGEFASAVSTTRTKNARLQISQIVSAVHFSPCGGLQHVQFQWF